LRGDYQNALRLGGHAAVDAPRNPKVHELISLALFALGKYRPAASEAHAAMALGAIASWNDLYAYYNDVNKYTTQLRALEKAAAENSRDAADHFLLGYHYLMTGARDNAKTELADAVKLTPHDKLASHYLQEIQSNSPLTPPQTASRPEGNTTK
jgi:tetratricopeptide (TPR) repeat protein